MTQSERDDAKGRSRKELMAKWQMLLSVVERRFKAAIAKEEKNGRLRPETEKTVATYIKTLQAFAKEVKQIQANGEADGTAAREVAENLWALSLSKRDKSAIASVLKELNLPVGKRPGRRGGESRERDQDSQEIQEERAAQRDLPLDEPADEHEGGNGTLAPS